MKGAIDISELRRTEVDQAITFGKPLGIEVVSEHVDWRLSVKAVQEDEWVGLAVTAPDQSGTPRVWIAASNQTSDRGQLICRLMDKAILKLRANGAKSCAVSVCGEDGEAIVSRTCWNFDEASLALGVGLEANRDLRSLDEVLDQPSSAETPPPVDPSSVESANSVADTEGTEPSEAA